MLLTLSAGCGAPSVRDHQAVAETLGFRATTQVGSGFAHRVYFNRRADMPGADRLHVYIDGDGIAWHGRTQPALEPQLRNPLVLRLMARDSQPAVYLGRPCYPGSYDPDRCQPWYWTHGRYGEAVVESMTRAVQRIAGRHGAVRLVLIGYSGGGSLAMLMAPRLTGVSDVVTLAANLDLDAWVAEHGYSPLIGSLNPAELAPLPSGIRQWHWAGGADDRVPPHVVERGLARQPAARYRVLPGVDHRCCWETRWPELLAAVVAAEDARR